MERGRLAATDAQGVRYIAPTDVAQFIRLEQCRRYLRLRLHERAVGSRFMRDYGVVPQSILPLLTRAGATFEQTIERAVVAHFPILNCAAGTAGQGLRADDNQRVVALARALAPGEVLVLFQPRLHATVSGWQMRGDVDILRLERDGEAQLHALIADMKSSTATKVEHRLQVAMYHEMLATLLEEEGVAYAGITMAVLYRGPRTAGAQPGEEEAAQVEAQRVAAEQYFGTRDALLDLVADPQSYRSAVRELVTDRQSTAAQVADAEFATIPYHLTYKCDGCLYNEFCMKWSAERDDLSLLPHLTAPDKSALQYAGISTVRELATLKEPPQAETPESAADAGDLIPAPGKEALVRKLATTRSVGPRLDELVHRARRYRRWKGDALAALSYIPSKGYGSLPYCHATHNPNLVRLYVDAQHDYLHDRLYMLGALVVACADGIESTARRRSIVHLAEDPPDTAAREEQLFRRWIDDTVRAVVELAAPDAEGRPRAPLHLIFFNSFEQRLLLDGLARHATTILGATPLYDFLTQLAAFDSPVATFLDREIRELKNYPMVCQSLQAVAEHLAFDWNAPQPYRDIFRTRLFDSWGKDVYHTPLLERDGTRAPSESSWYTNRARFNSQIPLEYAYAAFGELAAPPTGGRDDLAPYRGATIDLLRGFQARRLEALEHVAHDFAGNRQTEKRPFDLPDLSRVTEKAPTLAQALDEFVTIERHVELGDWKAARLAPPERRVLAGDTLLVRYDETEQEPEVAACNRENLRRYQLKEQYTAECRAAHPGAPRVQLPREQKDETRWSQAGMHVRLRIDCAGADCDLNEALALSPLREGDRIVLCPRTTVDTRLPVEERAEFTPTPRQMLYGTRAAVVRIVVARDEAGRATSGYVEVALRECHGGAWSRGFVFGSMDEPLVAGQLYTLDEDPNNWYGYWCAQVTQGLCAGGRNTLYERLVDPAAAQVLWPAAATEGQARFLDGLRALHEAGALDPFEPAKQEYIGALGAAPVLLVQGPPGTGKSYVTAFALFARLQGAMAADMDFRACAACKTHAATDVLVANSLKVQRLLRQRRADHPALFARYFDARLLDVPLFRARPRGAPPEGVSALRGPDDREQDEPRNVDRCMAARWCVIAATPGGIYSLLKERWPRDLFGHDLCACLVLDEASQMNLPEAVMAALPLKEDGQLIVVGDPRQMPPIVQHGWGTEPRRSVQEYRSYESLFLGVLRLKPPLVKFEESFRLHADMAEFLRAEIYVKDGIRYHSRRRETLPPYGHADPFVTCVLAPDHPIVVVVHDEADSQLRNPFEQALITPILEALADPRTYRLDPEHGLGVVVPHRAQRAALQEAVRGLTRVDPATGALTLSAVDTVERFQGDEREAIVVSATESDPDYVLASCQFLLDPRRLTVALSRARRKMVLVASRSVFSLLSADEETFAHAQLWKNLLRRTCTVQLWAGPRESRHVEVWGNDSRQPSALSSQPRDG